MTLDELLHELAEKNGSDLHLKTGRPPLFRISGDLIASPYAPLSRQDMENLVFGIMQTSQKQRFEEDLELDFSYQVDGLARFRVNAFIQRSEIGAVLRLIPADVPTVDGMGLPQVLKDLAAWKDGLVIVTGPTGSGKSTTLAAMIEHINNTRPVHVITIEDPIEFVYADKLATINQRELGLDTKELRLALRAALRQDPDVILMGEMRDAATIAFAITAAETGHLVFSTLHTNDAKQTLDRILDTFSGEQANQIKMQIALMLRGVVSQRLLKRADGTGRVAAVEILINSPNVKQIIEEGNTRDIEKAMATAGSYYQMKTFNQSLLDLVKSGLVTEDEALGASSTPDDLRLGLRGVSKGSSSGEFDLDFAAQEEKKGAKRGPKKDTKPAKPAPPPDKKDGGFSRGFEF